MANGFLIRKMFNAINLHENACKIKMKYYLLLNNNGHKTPTAWYNKQWARTWRGELRYHEYQWKWAHMLWKTCYGGAWKLKIENSPRVCYTSKRTEMKIFRYLHFHLTATWCTITKPQKQCLLTDKGFWQIWSMQTQGSPILTLCDLHVRDEHHGNKANRLW